MEEEQLCREIWTRWVPKRGQSSVLQGELLRQIGAAPPRGTGQREPKWCRDHAFFCAFLDHTLLDSGVLSPGGGERLHGVLVRLRSCGEVGPPVSPGRAHRP